VQLFGSGDDGVVIGDIVQQRPQPIFDLSAGSGVEIAEVVPDRL
jgi:hypothetical protein